MQLNNCDDSYHCTICEVVLRKSINHQDQGVISSSGHETTGNCKAATAKGFRVLLAIRKVFHYLNKETFRVSYPTFVRPRLIQAPNPCFKSGTDMPERVQRGGAKMVKILSGLSHESGLELLDLFLPS